MFAIVDIDGHQFKVKKSDVIFVNKLNADIGSSINIDKILMKGEGSDIKIGTPFVDQASVKLEVIEHLKGNKVLVFKKRRRKNSRRKNGHRQHLTKVKVSEII